MTDRWQVIVKEKGRERGVGDYDSKLDASLVADHMRERGQAVVRVALLREGEPPKPMSQACAVHQEHDQCPRETTLGTDPCRCPCHAGERPGRRTP